MLNLTALPPEDAIEFFRGKGFAIGFSWEDIWRQEHQRAFTVAKVMRMDILEDIREAVDEALEAGTTFKHFADRLTLLLQSKGWWGRGVVFDPVDKQDKEATLGSPHRLKVIYDTNLRTAHSEGQWSRIEDRMEDFPILVYDANNSVEPDETHSAWDGIVLSANDPWWKNHFPVKRYGCKCRARQMSERQAKRRGLDIQNAPRENWSDYTNRRTGETIRVPEGVHPSFHYPPGARGDHLDQYAAIRKQAVESRLADPLPKQRPPKS